MTWLEEPQKAKEFGENNEFGKNDTSEKIISPRPSVDKIILNNWIMSSRFISRKR